MWTIRGPGRAASQIIRRISCGRELNLGKDGLSAMAGCVRVRDMLILRIDHSMVKKKGCSVRRDEARKVYLYEVKLEIG
jgi:hypothetical protein